MASIGRKPWQHSGPDRRIRGAAGQAARRRRMARTNGLCEMCMADGHTTLATVVDHVVPLARGGDDVDANTRNLCDRHHEQVTATQFGRVDRSRRGVDRDGRPLDPDHPWRRG